MAILKARIQVEDIRRTIDAWRAVLPVQAADEGDLLMALDAGRAHRRVGPAAERMALAARLMPVSLLACARTMAR